MKFSAIVFATLVSVGLAQDLSKLPTCAATCFTKNFANTKCATTDIACLCGDKAFFSDVEICVLGACGSADITSTLTWATTECAAAGVPLKKRDVFGRKH